MLLNHTKPRTHDFHMSAAPLLDSAKKPIISTNPNTGAKTVATTRPPSLTLLPGINKISPEDFKTMAAHPGYKHLEESGAIQVVGEEDGISKYSAAKQKQIIEQTGDLKLLAGWREESRSVTTNELLEDQMLKIKEPNAYAEKKRLRANG